jgi:phospholipase D1/2
MSTAAPKDGGSNLSNLKNKIEHPFDKLGNKLHNTSLHDVKVKAIHKKYASGTGHI